MEHLSAERVSALADDPHEITDVEGMHIAGCTVCRGALETATQLLEDLVLLRRAAPSPEQLARYYGLFDQIEVVPSPIQRAWEALRVILSWDSRSRQAFSAVRSTSASSYRLLYETEVVHESAATDSDTQSSLRGQPEQIRAELELMVTVTERKRRIVGEFTSEPHVSGSMLELVDPAGVEVRSVVTAMDGRFQLEDVVPGHYRLALTTDLGTACLIDDLEIT